MTEGKYIFFIRADGSGGAKSFGRVGAGRNYYPTHLRPGSLGTEVIHSWGVISGVTAEADRVSGARGCIAVG